MRAPARWLLATAALLALAGPAHAFKVTTWNVMKYPSVNLAGRQPSFRTVMANLSTDMLFVQELSSDAGADSFLANVLKVAQPARVWKRTSFLSATESVVFYDSLTVASVSNIQAVAAGGPRQVLVCLVKPRGYLSNASWFRLYSIHFNAGTLQSDSASRTVECTNLRNIINNTVTTVVGPNFLLGGDTNFYGAYETGYTRLTESQADNDGRCKDQLSMPGVWNQSNYAPYHTQSPCASCPSSDYTGGGLDDRFDIIFSSYSLQDGAGLDVVGYTSFGNDGQHYNTDVNAFGFNNAVGITVANALHDAADHLPVVMTLQLPARVQAASALEQGTVITGAAATTPLTVSDGAPVPGAALHYSLSAPAGFTAPAGSFTAQAGQPGNGHAIGMDSATPGDKSGTLTISSDDPDSASKPVQLHGRVLRHAAASLDSIGAVTQQTLDFGTHAEDGFSDGSVRVFDLGYDVLQARLSLNAAVITGGNGRFSIPGGFSPGLIADVGRTLPVHFDATGATADSAYTATLVFHDADEPLPGATPQSDLTVHLTATSTGTVGVTPRPARLAFEAPRPNPFARTTEFAFELPAAAPVSLDVFDARGRRVATVAAGTWGAGRHTVRWDGLEARGAAAGAGLYFARFRTPGLERTVRLVRLP